MTSQAVRAAAPAPTVASAPRGLAQRCGGRSCPPGTCDHRGDRLRRQATGPGAGAAAAGPAAAPPVVHEVLRSPGRPLDGGTRGLMEARLGHDFSRVRVHTDARAAASAEAVGAHAYTVGSDVAFAAGRYTPATTAGRRLLAHELTHVVQQSDGGSGMAAALEVGAPDTQQEREADLVAASIGHGPGPSTAGAGIGAAPRRVARQPAPPAPAPAAPVYGPACGHPNPCQQDRCTGNQPATIQGDLARAIVYVDAAIRALRATPLADQTVRALDWYFTSHSQTTANLARAQLECIRWSLNDTQTNGRWGCHPDYDALAYTCARGVSICAHHLSPVCLTRQHFGQGSRERAETIVHECAHREGMSTDGAQTNPDIYQWHARFRNLSTEQALSNSDSYALFASAIATGGIPVTVIPAAGVTGGRAVSGGGDAVWFARVYLGAELQHPRLSMFSPTLGLGFTFIGEPAASGVPPATFTTSTLMTSLLPGIRISPPRPGAAGSGYASFFGGPAIAVGASTDLGAEAGVAIGYRWRWLDVSTGLGYTYDPTRREAGGAHLFTAGVTVSFVPLTL